MKASTAAAEQPVEEEKGGAAGVEDALRKKKSVKFQIDGEPGTAEESKDAASKATPN